MAGKDEMRLSSRRTLSSLEKHVLFQLAAHDFSVYAQPDVVALASRINRNIRDILLSGFPVEQRSPDSLFNYDFKIQ